MNVIVNITNFCKVIIMDQSLFGAFAKHNPESCPLNNVESKKIFLEIKEKLEKNKSKYGVNKIESFFTCQYWNMN